MNGVLTVIKVFAVVLVLGILAGLYFFLKDFRKDFADPSLTQKKPVEQIVEEADVDNFVPGQREYDRALELIAMDRRDEAREKLLFIQNLYPNSAHGPEARRILGEINLDEILSVENMENKSVHTVKAGEGYLKIANRHQTTLDCIMFLNGLMELGRLHRGDELTVMSLDFKLVIDLARQRIELFYRGSQEKEHVFAKEYPIQKLDIGRLRGRSILTKIGRKHGLVHGRFYRAGHPKYRHSTKVFSFSAGRIPIQLRTLAEADEEDPGQGIFLARPDMEELAMLIRIGNEVEIKPAG